MEMVGTTLGPQNLSTNTTDDYTEWKESFLIFLTFFKCILVVIAVMGFIGNGLVIFVTAFKMKTTVNSIWFLNLAIADFISILFVFLLIVAVPLRNILLVSNFMCKFFFFVTLQNMLASVFFLTVISVDRCLCTWLVVWAQNKRTLVKARIICVFVWILSICCSIPYAIDRSSQEYKGYFFCNSSSMNVLMSLIIYMFVLVFLIPFFIIISSYIAIGVRVKHLKSRNQLRPFRVISVILAFFICWFPFHVLQLCYISAVKNNWSNSVQEGIVAAGHFVTCLVYLNSCLNPILYVFMCDEYKKKLKTSLLLVLEGAFTEENLDLRSAPPACQVPNRQTKDTNISVSDLETNI